MAREEHHSGRDWRQLVEPMLKQQDLARMAMMTVEPVLRQERDLTRMAMMAVEPVLRQERDLARMAMMTVEPALRQERDLARMARIATKQIYPMQLNLGQVSREMKKRTPGQLQVEPVLQERRVPIRWKMKMNLKRMQLMALLTFKTKSKGENWATRLCWFVPRKYRNDIIGDILEDCAEMRETGYTERLIRFNVVYQWLIAVVTLVPTAVKTSITDILKQVISPPK